MFMLHVLIMIVRIIIMYVIEKRLRTSGMMNKCCFKAKKYNSS